MSERARRNEILEEELLERAEFLVRAEFKEDPGDEGYTTTRWCVANDVAGLEPDVHKELMDQIEEMEGLLEGLKSMLASETETEGDPMPGQEV